jgi:hypothetical protein
MSPENGRQVKRDYPYWRFSPRDEYLRMGLLVYPNRDVHGSRGTPTKTSDRHPTEHSASIACKSGDYDRRGLMGECDIFLQPLFGLWIYNALRAQSPVLGRTSNRFPVPPDQELWSFSSPISGDFPSHVMSSDCPHDLGDAQPVRIRPFGSLSLKPFCG